MTENFNPNHLLINELDYELAIRNVVTTRNMQEKRKILSRLLAREPSPGDSIDLNSYNFNFEFEQDAINGSLQSITTLVIDFEGNSSDSVFRRIISRLVHVSGRVQRIPIPEDETKLTVENFKRETRATCLHIESELYAKVIPDNSDSFQPNISHMPSAPVINVAPQVTSFKMIPISEWNIKFSGDKRFLYSFLERINELAHARNVSSEELFTSAVEFFVGDAFIWFLSIKSSVNNWEELILRLKRDFLPPYDEDEIWEQIKHRKQKRNESITIFIAQLENLFRRLPRIPIETTKVKYIRQNLLPEYFNQLALHDINTVAELTTLCKKLEDAAYIRSKNHSIHNVSNLYEQPFSVHSSNKKHGQMKNYKSNRKFINNCENSNFDSIPSTSSCNPTNNNNTIKKQIICWNCSKPNHTYSSCTLKRKLFCYRCGKADVQFSNCPNCSKKCSKN